MIIDFYPAGWFVGLSLLDILLFTFRKRQRCLSYLFCFAWFWVYLLLVIRWTLFPIYIDAVRVEGMRGHFMDSVNLLPFYFGPFTTLAHALPGLILNTLLTMPAGFGISFITRFGPRDLPWLVLAFGFGIEGLQLLISLLLGYPYRTIDANDVVFNSLGVLLGYGGFRASAWLYVFTTKRWPLRRTGFFSYLDEVTSRVTQV